MTHFLTALRLITVPEAKADKVDKPGGLAVQQETPAWLYELDQDPPASTTPLSRPRHLQAAPLLPP